jgi:tetratricopeptide (TPR) repeat protein
VVYTTLERYKESIDAFKKAIRLNPQLADAYYGLGLVYLLLGDKDYALEQYKILKNLNTDLANTLLDFINET